MHQVKVNTVRFDVRGHNRHSATLKDNEKVLYFPFIEKGWDHFLFHTGMLWQRTEGQQDYMQTSKTATRGLTHQYILLKHIAKYKRHSGIANPKGH